MPSLHADLIRALAGGALIGLAAAMFLLLNGRIGGISGILGGLLRPVRSELGWRIAFLLGLALSPLVFALFAPLPLVHVGAGKASLIVGGLLVGLGTRYSAGCTSGHGVCGIARLSPRSLAATAVFMLAGFVTVFVLRHLSGSGA
ncbi:YeeE/YedE family protein [Massilia sp. DJPM01]|uniref:YeeE/YedE family protein n=1 Tax=Massilia sp. DJPM01 TaxID=3024404 RepID=UPI00259D51D0|nr:YeeE/YedE family protein [Massilia sp. DJPM01]MDM5176553.1 YeeE/YedE family protein [Massilia sp. DJPM01]